MVCSRNTFLHFSLKESKLPNCQLCSILPIIMCNLLQIILPPILYVLALKKLIVFDLLLNVCWKFVSNQSKFGNSRVINLYITIRRVYIYTFFLVLPYCLLSAILDMTFYHDITECIFLGRWLR